MSLVVNISCTGAHDKKQVVLRDGESLKVGRTNSDASLIVDARLSRKHFIIRYVDGQIEITHLSQTNPTMIASQGTSDFQKVKGTRMEPDGCRIIAGSHRFVLAINKQDSVDAVEFSDELMAGEGKLAGNQSDIWSDVDSEPVIEADTRTNPTQVDKVRPKLRKPVETEPFESKDVPNETPFEQPTQTQPIVFDEEDSVSEVNPPARESESKPKKAPSQKPGKKSTPFFPIGDDFFDD